MNKEERKSYRALDSTTSDDNVLQQAPNELERYNICRSQLLLITALITLLLSTNGLWLLWFMGVKDILNKEVIRTYPVDATVLVPFYQDTPFGGQGEHKPNADKLWNSLFPKGDGRASLNMSEAKSHHLPDTVREQDNEGNGLYVMAGFHNIHCLAIIRASLFHFHASENQSAPWSHNVHCLDQLRQTLMCNTDTTLLYEIDGGEKFADGQVHICKDYWALHHWLGDHAPLDAE